MYSKFKAQLWKRSEDRDGEITIILKVPLCDNEQASSIPVLTELDVRIDYQASDSY